MSQERPGEGKLSVYVSQKRPGEGKLAVHVSQERPGEGKLAVYVSQEARRRDPTLVAVVVVPGGSVRRKSSGLRLTGDKTKVSF